MVLTYHNILYCIVSDRRYLSLCSLITILAHLCQGELYVAPLLTSRSDCESGDVKAYLPEPSCVNRNVHSKCISASYECDFKMTSDNNYLINVTICSTYEWSFAPYSHCQMDKKLVRSNIHKTKVYCDYNSGYFNKHGDIYISEHQYSQDRHICIPNPLRCPLNYTVLPSKFLGIIGLFLFPHPLSVVKKRRYLYTTHIFFYVR